MRVIKFRGKRLDNGAWETGCAVVLRQGLSDEQWFITDKFTGYHTPVDPKTVGQFTGLHDANGREIYEGDIVSKTTKSGYPDNCVGEIVFRDGLFGLKKDSRYGLPVRILAKSSEWVDGNASGVSIHEYEVIGNIYDNTELLKEHGENL